MRKVRSTATTYRARPSGRRSDVAARPERDEIHAKLFANGRSQAVRLPKQFRLPGTEVRISREGDRIILEPISDVAADANGWPIGFWDRLDADGAIDFPDPEPMPTRFLEPAEFDPGFAAAAKPRPAPKRR